MNLTERAVIRELMDKYGVTFTKSLGQNFLASPKNVERIADAAGLDGDTGVVEIGAGIGTLTDALAKRAGGVAAVELDRKLIPILNETMSEHDNVHVIKADARRLNYAVLCKQNLDFSKIVACANLPYYITTEVVCDMMISRVFSQVTVMMQKEAAKRLTSGPGGNYCAAAAILDFFGENEILFDVTSGCFMPEPSVDSSVVRFMPRQESMCPGYEKQFIRLVKAAFAQRRKTLANALSGGGIATRSRTLEVIEQCGLPDDVRGEALDARTMAKLTLAIFA